MPEAERHDIRIEVGADFRMSITWYEADGETPIDLTDYTAAMAVRLLHTDAEPLLALTSDPGGGIVLGDETGTIEIHADNEDTQGLTNIEGGTLSCVWDLLLTSPGGEARRLLQGVCRVMSAAARPWEA